MERVDITLEKDNAGKATGYALVVLRIDLSKVRERAAQDPYMAGSEAALHRHLTARAAQLASISHQASLTSEAEYIDQINAVRHAKPSIAREITESLKK